MLRYEYVTDRETLAKIAREIEAADVIALDLETHGFNPYTGRIRIVSINTGQGIYVIDLYRVGDLGPIEKALHNPFQEVGPGHPIVVGQNLKYDQKWLYYVYGTELWPVFDTYRSSAILHNGEFLSHDLYALYHRELEIAPEAPDLGGSNWNADVLTSSQTDYAAEDVTYLPLIREKLKPKLAAMGLNRIAGLEFGVILPEAVVELNGFYLNPEKWRELYKENREEQARLHAVLCKGLPHPKGQLSLPGCDPGFNFNSPPQMLASLKRLGLKNPENAKKPLENTKEMTLAPFVAQYPILKSLFDYRGVTVQCKTYGESYLRHVSPITGRIHTEFFPLLVTGRYAHTKPNTGNIPRDKRFRRCFEEQDGDVLTICDYSNIEMRLAAHISRDPLLIKVFREGKDAHYVTASIVLGIPESEVTKAQRQSAKAVNFGLIYGMQAKKLVLYALTAYGVTMTLDEAEQFRVRYFDAYRGVARWHERVFATADQTRCARTILGRYRKLDPETEHNEFINTPVQGSGADGLKKALRNVFMRLRKYGNDARMVHHVHDEIVTKTRNDPELIKLVEKDVEAGMIEGMDFLTRVPVLAEPSHGATWADKA